MRLFILFLICTIGTSALAEKQTYGNTTVNNHLIWPTMSPIAKEKLRHAVDTGLNSMVISSAEMQTLIDVTSKHYSRVTMGGKSRAQLLYANVKNWMDCIGNLKNYTHEKKSDAYFHEKKEAFESYIQQLKDLSLFLKKLKYNADFMADFLYSLYNFEELTFEQIGQFVRELKENYNSKSADTNLKEILEKYKEKIKSQKEEEEYDDVSIPGLD
jgi:hypothetical protein